MKAILEKEILPALGCTEPIAVAYAAAAAYKEIEGDIQSIECEANGNIIKNVTSVIIPGTNNLYGMKAAVAAGIASNSPELKLELLSTLDESKNAEIVSLLNKNIITVKPAKTDKSLYIKVKVTTEKGYAAAIIQDCHDNIILIEKNGKLIFLKQECETENTEEKSKEEVEEDLSLDKIYEYAKNTLIENLGIIKESIRLNRNICDEGLKNNYGLGIGKYMKESEFTQYLTNNAVHNTICITVAGTDARMAGCSLPAMSNSGSGNQGIAATMPVVSYGEYLNVDEEKLIRAVALSNLITIYVKKKIGRLSSLCGAVSAAAGASCGIIYLLDGNIEAIEKSIKNVLGNIAGMFCDGAKAGCSLKIATGTFAAILSAHKAMEGNSIKGTDGIVEDSVEDTLNNYSRISRDALQSLDNILLDIMVKK